jgi:hypothetical protein
MEQIDRAAEGQGMGVEAGASRQRFAQTRRAAVGRYISANVVRTQLS